MNAIRCDVLAKNHFVSAAKRQFFESVSSPQMKRSPVVFVGFDDSGDADQPGRRTARSPSLSNILPTLLLLLPERLRLLGIKLPLEHRHVD